MRLEQLEYFNNRHHHSLYTQWNGQVKMGQVEQLDVLCCVPEALRGCNSLKMTILVFLLLNMTIFFGQDLATAMYIISTNAPWYHCVGI
jgi:hypothetical protein